MAMEAKVGLVGVGSIYFCGLSTPSTRSITHSESAYL